MSEHEKDEEMDEKTRTWIEQKMPTRLPLSSEAKAAGAKVIRAAMAKGKQDREETTLEMDFGAGSAA